MGIKQIRKNILESQVVKTNLPVLAKERHFKSFLPLVAAGCIAVSSINGCYDTHRIVDTHEDGEKYYREVKCSKWIWQFEHYNVDENYEIIVKKRFDLFQKEELEKPQINFSCVVRNIPKDKRLRTKIFKEGFYCSKNELQDNIKDLISKNRRRFVEGSVLVTFTYKGSNGYVEVNRTDLAIVGEKIDREIDKTESTEDFFSTILWYWIAID
ncbi:hypothetical protein KO465_03610 [Candidatus Micrarchaeota archaeon]|nr:hypothetical protein [Candidatus Micrarchaeota archaeon]